jgi:hypothetical protein
MITRALTLFAAGLALAACQPAIPDSGQGVGFGNSFEQEQAQRDAALEGVPAPAAVAEASLAASNDGSAEATAAETARVLAATRPGGSAGVGTSAATNSGVAPLQASPSNPAPSVVNAAGISNENNFDAVAEQRSIGDDAALIAQNRAQLEIDQPTALPERSQSGPNIVAYALSSSNPVGTQIYTRVGLNKARKFQRACAQFTHPDQAQIAFLAAGGPERDREGMDPDGDGFACNWDPAPFRRVARG